MQNLKNSCIFIRDRQAVLTLLIITVYPKFKVNMCFFLEIKTSQKDNNSYLVLTLKITQLKTIMLKYINLQARPNINTEHIDWSYRATLMGKIVISMCWNGSVKIWMTITSKCNGKQQIPRLIKLNTFSERFCFCICISYL